MKKAFLFLIPLMIFCGCSKKQESKVTLIEIMSSSCSSCKEIKPVIEKIKEQYKNKINMIIYDADTPEGLVEHGRSLAVSALVTGLSKELSPGSG